MEIRLDPNPRQLELFRSTERFVAYGGARGGGKSWAVRRKTMLMALYYPGIRILILRRTFPQVRENHILPMRRELAGIAKWRESEKCFTFPNGSRIVFGYCSAESDVDQYQGQEYDVICLDEATQFTYLQFSALTACLRGVNDFPKRMYLTCNPGGVGHMWVKRLFVDRVYLPSENPDNYRFIPAKATDNRALMEHDSEYMAMLDGLPEDLRAAWRDGRWDVFAGRYFPEFREEVHVAAPRALDPKWPRYRVFDYGLDMLACFWAAVDGEGRIWIYRELCRSGLIVSEAAQEILEHTPPGEMIACTLAPPDMWSTQKDSGRTMGELFAENGVPLVRAANRRVQGWMAVKEFLKMRSDGLPGVVIFSDCVNLIRDLGAVQHDEKNPSDVAKQPHEYTHTVDALRYLCAWRAPAYGQECEQEEEEDEDTVGYREFLLG